MANEIEDPKTGDPGSLCFSIYCRVNCCQILFLPQNHADRQGELDVADVVALQCFENAASGERVLFGGLQELDDPLVGVEKPNEIGMIVAVFYFSDGDVGVHLMDGCRGDGTFEVQVQLGFF